MRQSNNGKDNWIRIKLSAPPELADALSNFLTEAGAQGVFQENSVSPFAEQLLEQPPEVSPRETLQAFIPDDAQAEDRIASITDYLKNLADLFPELEPAGLAVEMVSDPGWGEEWKKYFKPFRVGRGIVIKPTWERHVSRNGDTVIEIDPGMAFGTGQHASTLMCLESIEDILGKDLSAGANVLDVGTGTGILGIAAARLGAKEVICIDIDEKAVEIARENAAINNVAGHLDIRKSEPSAISGLFSLVVANITSKPLIGMRDDFVSLLRFGGCLVISGIMEQDKEELERHFLAAPFHLCRLRRQKEWLCYVLRKGVDS